MAKSLILISIIFVALSLCVIADQEKPSHYDGERYRTKRVLQDDNENTEGDQA